MSLNYLLVTWIYSLLSIELVNIGRGLEVYKVLKNSWAFLAESLNSTQAQY